MKKLFFSFLIISLLLSGCENESSKESITQSDNQVEFRNVKIQVYMAVAAGSGNATIRYTNESGGESEIQGYLIYTNTFKYKVGTKVVVSASCESELNMVRRSTASVSIKIYNESSLAAQGYQSDGQDNSKVKVSTSCSAVIK